MGTTTDKLQAIWDSTEAIRVKLGIAEDTPLSKYVNYIDTEPAIGSSAEYFKCVAVGEKAEPEIALNTWNGQKAVFDEENKCYYLQETITEGLTYENGFVPEVGGIYSKDCLIEIERMHKDIQSEISGSGGENGKYDINADIDSISEELSDITGATLSVSTLEDVNDVNTELDALNQDLQEIIGE